MTRLKQMVVGKNPRRTLVRALVLAVTAYLFFGYLVRPVRVRGISMEPTLVDGSIHLVNLTHFWFGKPERGDVVAVAMPGRRAYFMKRILAMPGERIAFDQGRLVINGVALEEPYLAGPAGHWNMTAREVPPGWYFIAGDNRDTPFEGHTLGLVDGVKLSGTLLR